MVASGGTVGAQLGCGIFCCQKQAWWLGEWSLSWSSAKLATALLAFHLGRRMEYVWLGP